MIIRIVARIALLLIALVVIITLGLGYLTNSQWGLDFVTSKASLLAKNEGVTLFIENPRGTLLKFSAKQVVLKTPSMQLRATDTELKWNPFDLLLWELNINNIFAKTLNLKLKPTQPAEQAHHAFALPHITVDQIGATHFAITFANKKTLTGTIHSHVKNGQTHLTEVKLSYQSLKLSLVKPVDITHHNRANNWNNLCLKDTENNEICTSGQFTNTANWHIEVTPNIHNLNILDSFLSTTTQTQGKITGTLSATLNPNIKAPKFSGKLHITGGSTLIPIIGMHPTNIKATLMPQNNNLTLFGTSKVGKGVLTITGQLLLNQPHQELRMTFIGGNLSAINTPAAQINLSPVITYTLQNGVQSVTGTTYIPSATINGDKIHQSASSTEDVVYVGPNGKIMKSPGLKLSTQVAVSLGKDVNFTGFGIHTKLKGTLLVDSKPGAPLLGKGIWNLYDGHYTTHGKQFTLKKSSLIFNGSPLNNPNLNVTAEYNLPPGINGTAGSQNITLGLNVGGSISEPKLNFFSNPAMSQNDILSYIIFGVPATKANASQQAEISQAALSYALNNGNLTGLSEIKQKLGIDSIGVGTISTAAPGELASQSTTANPQNNTAVFVGKQITKRLYVSYGVGLFNQTQELKTQFMINKYFELRTDSSSESNGADLVFTYNR